MMTILRLIDPRIAAQIGPWLSFCLYLAARVYIQALQQPDHTFRNEHQKTLEQIMQKLRLLQVKSPYTATLILQLERDYVGSGKANPLGHVIALAEEVVQVKGSDLM
jgi:hypothetical protein